jgi:pyridinium-3,5-biscarboxylic acid mononucleotide synthase
VSFTDLGFARVDTDRRARRGFPEVIFCAGKLPDQILHISRALLDSDGIVLGTRATPEHHQALIPELPDAHFHAVARCITIIRRPLPPLPGIVAVVCAGTSDIPVAEEAAVTLETFGAKVDRISDVGVAGIHRLLAVRDRLEAANAVIVAAGMEGALPSAVAGLISKPVIAVPTSIGYGASFGGIAALLGMLNSCGSGVTVVNIDNGFGAAYAAANISRLLSLKEAPQDSASAPT